MPSPADLAGTRCTTPLPERLNTAVVMDYQNVHMSAYDAFVAQHGEPYFTAHIDPVRTAERVLSLRDRIRKRNDVAYERSVLARLDIHRPLPRYAVQPLPAAITEEQARRWRADDRVTVHLRPMHYTFRDGECVKAKEKGVDAAAAVAVYRAACDPRIDLVVLVGHDCDLAPGLEAALADTDTRIETAGWAGLSTTLHPADRDGEHTVWRTFLHEEDYRDVHDGTDYAAYVRAEEEWRQMCEAYPSVCW